MSRHLLNYFLPGFARFVCLTDVSFYAVRNLDSGVSALEGSLNHFHVDVKVIGTLFARFRLY